MNNMSKSQLEAFDDMTADRDRWRDRFEKLDRELKSELRDPNGTIWEHAERLQAELDKLRAANTELLNIHTAPHA